MSEAHRELVSTDGMPARATEQSNKFGFLRLTLASLVLISHAPELVDGNRSRELLTMFGRSLSFGELAVDGFFLLSGYLITRSVERSASASSYIRKRMLRIVPGFAAAYALCILCSPLVGGALTRVSVSTLLLNAVLLLPPEVPGAFEGLPYTYLNGAMWTIAYEFRCYLLALLLGGLGFFKRPQAFAWVVGFAGLCLLAHPAFALPKMLEAVTGSIDFNARLMSLFVVGAGFHVLRGWLPAFSGWRVLGAAAIAVASLFSWRLAEFGVALFGGYVMFWFALATPPNLLNGIGRRADISYGVYLYAWPVQNSLIWAFSGISPALVFVTSIPITLVLGWLSWVFVEAPMLRLKSQTQTTYQLLWLGGER